MKEELTTRMHSEFILSDEEERKANAFAAFQGVSETMSLNMVLHYFDMKMDDVQPFIAQWNSLSTKQITIQ